jgi:DNA-binding MarR family transcriptional regulator
MNLRQLHYLLAIADEGSFTRAAEHLLVAQPSLSQQIKSLERELGGPLLERLPKGVRLTAAGKAFLPEARAAVTHAERARRNARSALGLEAGELEVATVTSVAFGVLPPAFERWRERYPGMTITLREYTHRRPSTTQSASESATSPSAHDRPSGQAPSSNSDGRSSSPSSQPPTRWPRASVRSRSKNWRNATGCCSGPATDCQSSSSKPVRARGSRRAEPSRLVKSPQPLTSPRPDSASRSCRTTSSHMDSTLQFAASSHHWYASSSRLLVRTCRLSPQRSWRCCGRRRGAAGHLPRPSSDSSRTATHRPRLRAFARHAWRHLGRAAQRRIPS